MNDLQLAAEHYRRLPRVRWAPKGVSLLVGPNGSGKTTLLSLYQFLSDYLVRDLEKAIEFSRGAWGLKLKTAIDKSSVCPHATALLTVAAKLEIAGQRIAEEQDVVV